MNKYPPSEMDIIGGTEDGIRVQYDYDQGEEQWFDARAGVGSPGYPPSVYITAIWHRSEWRTPDELPWLDIEACEKELMEKIIESEARDEQS